MCWDMNFPDDWLCSLTVMAPKVVGATCLTKFRPIAGLCALRKVLGYVWLKSLPPLKYESVQPAFVPKTYADAGLFLLMQASELSREWEREIVVVQLDVKKAFDHVDHRAAFRAMKLQGVSLFSIALIAAIWNGSCMKARLGNGDVEQSSDEPGTSSRGAGISSHLFNDHGIGAARLDEELDFKETGLETGRFHAGCDLLCGRCGVDCCIGVCCRNNGVRSDRKTERLADCWCTENTLDEFSEDDRQKHHGGWIGCWCRRMFWSLCVIDGVSGRECKTCDRTQNRSSQQLSGEMETCVEFSIAPQIVAAEHCKDYDVPLEFECLAIYRWEDMVAGEVSKFVGNADGLSKTVQDNTGWLHVAQNRGSWKQFSNCGKSPEKMVMGASGTQARPARLGQMLCVGTERKRERVVWRALGTPTLCIKPSVTLL